MRCAENNHGDHRRDIVQPDGGAQVIQHREYRQRQRDKKERPAQQLRFPPAREIAEPDGIVQRQKPAGQIQPYAAQCQRLTAHQQHHRQQIRHAAALLHQLHPAGDRRGLRFFHRWKEDIGDVDQHGQGEDHQPGPGEGYRQIHSTTPAFSAKGGIFVGLP